MHEQCVSGPLLSFVGPENEATFLYTFKCTGVGMAVVL